MVGEETREGGVGFFEGVFVDASLLQLQVDGLPSVEEEKGRVSPPLIALLASIRCHLVLAVLHQGNGEVLFLCADGVEAEVVEAGAGRFKLLAVLNPAASIGQHVLEVHSAAAGFFVCSDKTLADAEARHASPF